MRLRALTALLTCFFSAFCAVAQQGSHKVLLLSDTHFNPFPTDQQCAQPEMRARMAQLASRPGIEWTPADFSFQTGLSKRGEDSNWPLLHSAIQAARRTLPKPDAVFISGDLLVHHADRWYASCFAPTGEIKDTAAFTGFLVQAIAFEMAQFEQAFPGVPVITALGNNDTDTGDYKLPSQAFLNGVEPVFARASGSAALPDMAQDFNTGGYYAAAPPKLRRSVVLVLNSNAFSDQAQSRDKARSGPAARAQLAWLSSSLADARKRHRSVLVMGHVPPGLDAYTSHATHSVEMMYGDCKQKGSGVCTDYADDVPAALTNFSATVRMGIFGHTHMDDVRVTGPGGVPIEIVPSVSPNVGNNPGFVVLTLSGDLKPLDHTVYRLPLSAPTPQWAPEYSFKTAYGLPDFSAASLEKLHDKLQNDLPMREAYFMHFNGGSDAAKVPAKWQPAYLCALTNLTPTAVTPCLLEAVGMPAPF